MPVDESVYSGATDSGVVFQWVTDHWQYTWKTDKSQAGSTWRVGVKLDDGTTHYVTVALR